MSKHYVETIVQADDTFVSFLDQHTDALLVTAYLLTHDRLQAEELVQDTLVSLFAQWPRVQSADSSLAYVRRALLNRHLNQRRSRRHSREVSTDIIPEIRSYTDFSHAVADRDELRRALQTLPDRQQAAIVLRYFHDLDDRAAAELIGCRVGTLRSLISRGLSTLRANGSLHPTFNPTPDDPAPVVRHPGRSAGK